MSDVKTIDLILRDDTVDLISAEKIFEYVTLTDTVPCDAYFLRNLVKKGRAILKDNSFFKSKSENDKTLFAEWLYYFSEQGACLMDLEKISNSTKSLKTKSFFKSQGGYFLFTLFSHTKQPSYLIEAYRNKLCSAELSERISDNHRAAFSYWCAVDAAKRLFYLDKKSIEWAESWNFCAKKYSTLISEFDSVAFINSQGYLGSSANAIWTIKKDESSRKAALGAYGKFLNYYSAHTVPEQLKKIYCKIKKSCEYLKKHHKHETKMRWERDDDQYDLDPSRFRRILNDF